jgi:cystathionine beta-lyase
VQDILPLWIADTDFQCPQPVIDAMVARAQHGIYGYPINAMNFNRAVAHWQKERFGWDVEAGWVEYTPAVIPAIIYAIKTFSQPGDQVLIQCPVYPPFHAAIINNGRIIVNNQLVLEDGQYHINFQDLEAKLKQPRTRLMVLCHPHNPVGKAFTREELLRIGELCAKHHVLVVVDEIHQDIIYHGCRHYPFASLSDTNRDNSITCVNPSKTFNTAGVRTGAVIIPDKAIRELFYECIVNHKSYGRTIFGTLPLEVAYTQCGYYADQLMAYLEINLKCLMDFVEQHLPGIRVIKPQATYLIWLDCRGLGLSQKDLVKLLMEKAKVALNDGESFGPGGTGFMRMNIACPKATLEEGLRRIQQAMV